MSEISRLREQIERECKAGRLAPYGYIAVAYYEVFEQKYNILGKHQEHFEGYMGKEKSGGIADAVHQ